jgi:hypothetical protein
VQLVGRVVGVVDGKHARTCSHYSTTR